MAVNITPLHDRVVVKRVEDKESAITTISTALSMPRLELDFFGYRMF